jgi:hypothetical protein
MTPDHGLWQGKFIPGHGSNVFVARLCDLAACGHYCGIVVFNVQFVSHAVSRQQGVVKNDVSGG